MQILSHHDLAQPGFHTRFFFHTEVTCDLNQHSTLEVFNPSPDTQQKRAMRRACYWARLVGRCPVLTPKQLSCPAQGCFTHCHAFYSADGFHGPRRELSICLGLLATKGCNAPSCSILTVCSHWTSTANTYQTRLAINELILLKLDVEALCLSHTRRQASIPKLKPTE